MSVFGYYYNFLSSGWISALFTYYIKTHYEANFNAVSSKFEFLVFGFYPAIWMCELKIPYVFLIYLQYN